jgi:Uncharacterised methyltransferase family (DUF6094)
MNASAGMTKPGRLVREVRPHLLSIVGIVAVRLSGSGLGAPTAAERPGLFSASQRGPHRMRLAAVAKCGFYPASLVAIDGILKHLRLAEAKPDHQFILDPCAGEGQAIKQIAEGLGVPFDRTYVVELDLGRTEGIKENLPGVNVLGPATFMGVQITGHSFGLVYCNPPFDFEEGGGRREEQSFVMRSTYLLAPKGILALVCPMNTLIGNRSFVEYIDANFEDIQVYKFPDEQRNYNEIVLFGRKRKTELPGEAIYQFGELHQRGWQWRSSMQIETLPSLGDVQPTDWDGGIPSDEREDAVQVWEIPPGSRPHTFKKTTFTEVELTACLAASPLNDHFKEVTPLPLKRPPLPLDKGHLGLILASGMLDGVVAGPHESHVVRGSSTKIEYHNKELSKSDEDPETGAVTTKEVYSQRMVTIIRCVTQDGKLYTFSNAPKEPDDEDDQAGFNA